MSNESLHNKNLSKNLNSLSRSERIRRDTEIIREERSTQVATVGKGRATSGSGISSPLTEQSRLVDNTTVYDPSGLIAVTFQVARQVHMTDAAGRAVSFVYAT